MSSSPPMEVNPTTLLQLNADLILRHQLDRATIESLTSTVENLRRKCANLECLLLDARQHYPKEGAPSEVALCSMVAYPKRDSNRPTSARASQEISFARDSRLVHSMLQDAGATLEGLQTAAAEMEDTYKVKLFQAEEAIARKETVVTELKAAITDLNCRVATDVLRRRELSKMETAYRRLAISKQARRGGLARLEAMERGLMQSHDDMFHVQRFASLKAPVVQVSLVFTLFPGMEILERDAPSLVSYVTSLFRSAERDFRNKYGGHSVAKSPNFSCCAFQSAVAAVYFAVEFHAKLLEYPYPEAVRGASPYFSEIRNEFVLNQNYSSGSLSLHQAEVLFNGPRLRSLIWTGDPCVEIDPGSGFPLYQGKEVVAALQCLATTVRNGEVLAVGDWATRVRAELQSKNSTQQQQLGKKSLDDVNLMRAHDVVELVPVQPLQPTSELFSTTARSQRESVINLDETADRTSQIFRELLPGFDIEEGPPCAGLSTLNGISVLHSNLRHRRRLTARVGGFERVDLSDTPSCRVLGLLLAMKNPPQELVGKGLAGLLQTLQASVLQHTSAASLSPAPLQASAIGVRAKSKANRSGMERKISAGSSSVLTPTGSTPRMSDPKTLIKYFGLYRISLRQLEAHEKVLMGLEDAYTNAQHQHPFQLLGIANNYTSKGNGNLSLSSPVMNPGGFFSALQQQPQLLASSPGTAAQGKLARPEHSGLIVVCTVDVFDFVSLSQSLEPLLLSQLIITLRNLVLQTVMPFRGAVLQYYNQKDGFVFGFPLITKAIEFASNLLLRCNDPLIWGEVISAEVGATHPSLAILRDEGGERVLFTGLRVRVGIGFGAANLAPDPLTRRGVSLKGPALNSSLRVAACARGGEILLSSNAMQSARGDRIHLSLSYCVMNRGFYALRGDSKPQELFAILPAALSYRQRFNASRAPVVENGYNKLMHLVFCPAPENFFLGFPLPESDMKYLTAQQIEALKALPMLSKVNRSIKKTLHGVATQLMLMHDTSGMLGQVAPSGPSEGASFSMMYVDVEGSFGLFNALGELFSKCQQHFNYLVQDTCRRFDGYTVKHNGFESFLLAYNDPESALEAALELQNMLLTSEWPTELIKQEKALRVKDPKTGSTYFNGLRCRIGLAFGPVSKVPVPRSTRIDFNGAAAVSAFRLGRSAAGGDIWASPEFIGAVETHSSSGFALLQACNLRQLTDSRNELVGYGCCHKSLVLRIQKFSRSPVTLEDSGFRGVGLRGSRRDGKGNSNFTDDQKNLPWWRQQGTCLTPIVAAKLQSKKRGGGASNLDATMSKLMSSPHMNPPPFPSLSGAFQVVVDGMKTLSEALSTSSQPPPSVVAQQQFLAATPPGKSLKPPELGPSGRRPSSTSSSTGIPSEQNLASQMVLAHAVSALSCLCGELSLVGPIRCGPQSGQTVKDFEEAVANLIQGKTPSQPPSLQTSALPAIIPVPPVTQRKSTTSSGQRKQSTEKS